MQIPIVSLNDDGKIVLISEEDDGTKLEEEPVNKEKRKLTLSSIPFSLTCILHKNYILADPTAEEESIMETLVTVVLDSSSRLVSFYKPGGPVLAQTSAVQVSLCFWEYTLMVPEIKFNVKESIQFVVMIGSKTLCKLLPGSLFIWTMIIEATFIFSCLCRDRSVTTILGSGVDLVIKFLDSNSSLLKVLKSFDYWDLCVKLKF